MLIDAYCKYPLKVWKPPCSLLNDTIMPLIKNKYIHKKLKYIF